MYTISYCFYVTSQVTFLYLLLKNMEDIVVNKLKEYLNNVNGVIHTTLNPNGPGVVRIHLVPPKKPKLGVPWVIILNGQDVLPLNTGWAILLSEFISEANRTNGKPLTDKEIKILINKTISQVRKVFPKTSRDILMEDLKDIVNTLTNIAKGIEPSVEIGYMTLAQYSKYMRAPHRMDLMVSSMVKDNCWNCNQKCIHCYASNQELAIVEELSTDEWKKIINKCKDAYIPQLTFTGGEPTLREDLVELVKYASWFVTRVNTNGIKLSKSLCNELYEASLDSVQVTLYSNNKEIHNQLVGANHFDETVAGIKNALAAGLNVSINTPLCDLNKEYLDTVKFAKNLGVRYFSCSGLILTGNAKDDTSAITRLNKEELLDILKQVVNFCHDNELEISFTSPGWIKEEDLKELKLIVPSCGACLSNMAIAPNGEVIPCQSWLSDGSIGNLLTDSWKNIWESKKCKTIRKQSAKMAQVCPLSKRTIMEENN